MTNEEAISVIENEIQIDVRLCTDEQVERFQDALYKAIDALKSRPTGEALTLDQLREMDGKPVFVHVIDHTVFADKEDDFDGWGMCRKSWVRVWDSKRSDIVHIDYDFDDYGEYWIAYANHPAHIDREAWEPCGVCGKADGVITARYCTEDAQGLTITNHNVKSVFCPKCGRPLTPDAWAMLEKRLRG